MAKKITKTTENGDKEKRRNPLCIFPSDELRAAIEKRRLEAQQAMGVEVSTAQVVRGVLQKALLAS